MGARKKIASVVAAAAMSVVTPKSLLLEYQRKWVDDQSPPRG